MPAIASPAPAVTPPNPHGLHVRPPAVNPEPAETPAVKTGGSHTPLPKETPGGESSPSTPEKTSPPTAPTAPPKEQDDTGESPGMTGNVPFVPPQSPAVSATPLSLEDQEAKDRAHFHELKAKALEDPNIKALRDKADHAPSEEAARKAEKEYDQALFSKVRAMDPSLSDYLDRLENAAMKRINGDNQ